MPEQLMEIIMGKIPFSPSKLSRLIRKGILIQVDRSQMYECGVAMVGFQFRFALKCDLCPTE